MRSRLVVIRASAAAALALAAGLCSCNRPGGEPGPLAASTAVPSFEDMTPSSGIDFERDNGHDTKSWRVVETVNGGLALLDFDSDGRLDIYFTNGRPPGRRRQPGTGCTGMPGTGNSKMFRQPPAPQMIPLDWVARRPTSTATGWWIFT